AAGHPLPLDYPAGSSIEDPTGLIGHIGFGLVYAVWAGWLIHRGYLLKGRERILCWFLAAISFGMIFLAQGRSGYLVAVAVLLAASWKIWLHRTSRQTVAAVVLASLAISSIALLGPARERLSSTVSSIHSVIQGDIAHAEERVSLWYLAWKGIRSHPWFGLGTGGYSTYAKKQADSDPRIHLNIAPGHPHQIYLAAWTRWGPVGLLLVLALFWTWIRRGSQASWHANDASLVLLSALALAVHGLSAPSLDEYFASIYAVLWLGLGLGAMHQEEVQ
ncbi:MAG: O-antigen ligase domain-containing protein, partial [Bacteroidetes bacterium]